MPSTTISLGVAAVLLAPTAREDSSARATAPAAVEPADRASGSLPAKEQPAAGSEPAGSGSTSAGGSAGGSAGVPSGRQFSARGPSEGTPVNEVPDEQANPREDKWINRYPPRDNMAEFGVFGGVWFPSRRLELFLPEAGHQRLRRVAPEIGLRAGYYPLRFVGVEAEGAVLPTRTAVTEARATAWALRGHVIGQLGLWSVTPFLLAGVGMIGVASPDGPEGIGNDQDFTFNLGTGVKVFVNDYIQLRLDVRDVISNRIGVGEGFTSSPEILLGVTFTLGKRSEPEPEKQPEPPPPINDRDRDTVLDEDDYCPDTFGMPPRGCPQVCVDDNDADGLTNPEDACPEDPENRNGFEDDDGCPDELPPELEKIAGVIEGIYFDNDKDVIRPESRPALDNAVEVLKRNPEIRVLITGHTSSPGGYRHNIDLSKRRAASVRTYFVQQGISGTRLETDGVGPDQPIDTNETKEGQARNRRIEFKILEGKGAEGSQPAIVTKPGAPEKARETMTPGDGAATKPGATAPKSGGTTAKSSTATKPSTTAKPAAKPAAKPTPQ